MIPQIGKSYPLGATVMADGVNFSVYSRSSTGMELLLFENRNSAEPERVIVLDRRRNRTFNYWHVFVPGLRTGQIYAFRASGPYDPHLGHRFDSSKVLLDPYGKAIAMPTQFDRQKAVDPGDNAPWAMKSVVVDSAEYDWEGDQPLHRPFESTVIYEMHVRGFTMHPSSGVSAEKRGTYAGVIEKIPYLKELGITAVELMPIFAFDRQEAPEGMTNYWGYNPVSFFAPCCLYSSDREPLRVLDEFRDMVKALHQAGIEVILDVVYNHTAEGDHRGPTYCFRGLENRTYYMLEHEKGWYANYSGTGNTLNANHSMVRQLILDSLRYWVSEMHVDGFRFDLASILSRDAQGRPLGNPPIVWDVENDPVLAGTKLIAEAWDAAGLYQVGNFFGDRWREWNGQFRDDVRSFVKSDPGMVHKFAQRFFGSPDIYGHRNREPEQSINFVTAHDGFTLNDLVSYNEKHNAANGEDNRDGHNHSHSWNCGVEGPTDDPEIEGLRNQQVKNLLLSLLMSVGVPMLLMGDEMRRTQRGNNNAYCQDNDISWMDWTLLDKHRDIHDFVRRIIHFRLHVNTAYSRTDLSLAELLQQADIQWHGTTLQEPDEGFDSRCLAFTVRGRTAYFHIILNAYWTALEFELPPMQPGSRWRRIADTSLDSPDDFSLPAQAAVIEAPVYVAMPRSIVMLLAERR
jgi:glycogen operon protein